MTTRCTRWCCGAYLPAYVEVGLRHFNLFGSDFDSVNLSGAICRTRPGPRVRGGQPPACRLCRRQPRPGRPRPVDRDGGKNFSGANLTGADLVSVQAANANFTNAVLDRTDLSELVAPRAVFVHASMDQRRRRRLRHEPGWRRFRDANLTRLSASETDLRDANLSDANLTKADLPADLEGADLSQASAVGASFATAEMQHANLSNANLTGADFTDANLTGSVLAGATLTGATFYLATCPGGTKAGRPPAKC